MVAYLEKSTEHADFDEIVDFLNASPIRYALTIENLTPTFNDEFATPSHTKKVFANIRRQGKDFSGTVTPLFSTMLIQPQADMGEGSGQLTKPQHTPTPASPSNIEPIPISSGPTTLVEDETVHEERGDIMERAATTATSLDIEQDSGSGSGPRHQDTILGDRPAQTRVLALENVKTAQDAPITTAGVSVSTAEPTTPPPTTTLIEDEDLTIAQTLMKMRRKSIMKEPEKPVKLKSKDQIAYDKEVAQRLQEELDKEARLKREREEEASNAALIEEWDNVQAMMDADYELATRIQA
ncbi:hypothetical protein Tco_0991309 [Tanacetum coccineum]|uniref:Uncharacterized protein n=1 Tax=Tanacetum coccineum TaxID=301880 RepID=A0ABQ5EZ70_9ASTR